MAQPPGGLSARLRPAPSQRRPEAEEIFAGLPTAALAIGPRGAIEAANLAALTLFNTGFAHLREIGADGLFGESAALFGARDDADVRRAYDVELATADGARFSADIAVAALADRPEWRIAAIHPRGSAQLAGQRGAGGKAQLSAVGAAAMLAHEIKNPLSAIRGAAQLIGDSDPAATELTALIRKEVDRIAALIDRMESFTDGRSLARAPLNIHSVLDHVCEIAGKGFGDGVAIARYYDPSLPEIVGNHDALVQVFLNLLKNAVEAIENASSGTVSINTAYRHGVSVRGREGEGRLALPIEVSVRDNGPGAPDELAGHIFEPFVTTKRSGTGLGLALADKIVADHDAIIEYHRDREAGVSVFRVLLPRAGGTP